MIKKIKNNPIVIILIFGFLIRAIISPFGTLQIDFNTFVAWSHILNDQGFQNFYKGWSDYLPGYLYVLFILGKISSYFSLSEYANIFLYKLPAILADLGTGFLIYKIVKQYSLKWANISSLAYIFNPAIFINSATWGQVDGLIPFFVLLSFFLLKKNIFLSSVFLTIGTLVKPQAAFAGPLFVIIILQTYGYKKTILYIFTSLLVFILGFLPFTTFENLLPFVFERLNLSANQYPYTSVNAFNFWAIVSPLWSPDYGVYAFSLIITAVSFIVALVLQKHKRDERLFGFSLSLIFLFSFLFLTRIHERHLLTVFAPLAIYSTVVPLAWISYVGLSIIYLLNLVYSHVWISDNFTEVFPESIIRLLSFVNLFLTLILVASSFRATRNKIKNIFSKFFITIQEREVTTKRVKNISKILFLVLLFAAVTRLINLQNPHNFYFDEVYHAYTAQEIVVGNSKAWEYLADPPEGVAYEWTHPPMAKLFMAGSMKIFGLNSFAWRLPGVIFGVISIFLLFQLARIIFKSELIAIFSAILFSVDGLNFTLSRIGMNDTYFIFFLLGTILFFLKNKYFWSALFLGGAVASKWTAFFILPILFVAWALYKRDLKLNYLWFLIIPPIVYLVSYLIFFMTGHSILDFWHTQQQMWWYHTQLVATHPYSSPWWSWPLMLKPIWVYTKDNSSSNIYLAGNQIIFYSGLVSIFAAIIIFVKQRLRVLYFVIFCYIALFLPWSQSPRIMFLYHYLPAVPFMVMLTGFLLDSFWRNGGKLFVIIFIALTITIFILYYPLFTGIEVFYPWNKVRF